MKPIVYVDMDGVLVDLFNHIGSIHDVEHYSQMTIAEYDAFFKNTNAYELFRDVPAFETANDLISMVKTLAGEYTILSSPLNFDRDGSIKGKQEWLKKHLSIQPDNIVFEHEKYKYAKTDETPNILIDDFRKNLDAWEAAGGIGIKYQGDENTIEELMKELTAVLK